MRQTQYIVWKDEYSVGRSDMDRQHQAILSLINRLYVAQQGQPGFATISPMLEGLLQFTVTHFSQEERLLEKGGYPDLERHKKAHAELARSTRMMVQQFLTEKEDATFNLLAFLRKWWTQHIVGLDQECKPYLPPEVKVARKLRPNDLV